jgi:hypothetical protein
MVLMTAGLVLLFSRGHRLALFNRRFVPAQPCLAILGIAMSVAGTALVIGKYHALVALGMPLFRIPDQPTKANPGFVPGDGSVPDALLPIPSGRSIWVGAHRRLNVGLVGEINRGRWRSE